jgi:hypothetical protein
MFLLDAVNAQKLHAIMAGFRASNATCTGPQLQQQLAVLGLICDYFEWKEAEQCVAYMRTVSAHDGHFTSTANQGGRSCVSI